MIHTNWPHESPSSLLSGFKMPFQGCASPLNPGRVYHYGGWLLRWEPCPLCLPVRPSVCLSAGTGGPEHRGLGCVVAPSSVEGMLGMPAIFRPASCSTDKADAKELLCWKELWVEGHCRVTGEVTRGNAAHVPTCGQGRPVGAGLLCRA